MRFRTLLAGGVAGLLVGLTTFTVVASGQDSQPVGTPAPEELITGQAEGELAEYCEQVPCTFITTDGSLGETGGTESSTALDECPGAAEAIEEKGYYMPAFGGFEGPCPTAEQLEQIKPYTGKDAFRDKLAIEAMDREQGEQADPALLEAMEQADDEEPIR